MSTDKKVTLVTADKVEFEVDEAVAMKFETIKSFLEENPEKIPLPNVYSKDLSLSIKYCKDRLESASSSASSSSENKTDEEAKKLFDENFVKPLDNETLKSMILAANYLEEKELFELLAAAIADRIKNKSPEYVRKYFGIENDFTPEEEERLRLENQWAFEGVDED